MRWWFTLASLFFAAGATGGITGLHGVAFAQEPPGGVESAPNPYLAQAKVLYSNLDFEKCLQRLDQAPQWRSSRSELLEIELYGGMCHFNLDHVRDAEERFQVALQIEPDAELPPYTSPKIVELFRSVKKRIAARVKPPDAPVKPPELTPRPVQPEPVVVAQPPRRRKLALPLGLAAGSVASSAGAVFFGLRARELERKANVPGFESDGIRIGRQAREAAVFTNIAIGLAVAAAGGAAATYLLQPTEP